MGRTRFGASLATMLFLTATISLVAAPTVFVQTDRDSYAAGDTIEVSLGGENFGEGRFVAVYVGFLSPVGRLFTFRNGTWDENALPWIEEIYVPGSFSMAATAFWWLPTPSSAPPIGDPGDYNFAAGLTTPGTFDFVSDISFAPFTVAAGYGTVEGRVCVEGTDMPIEGAQVSIGQTSDVTAPDGTYSLEGVPLGDRVINAEFPGFELYEATIEVTEGSNTHHIYLTPSTQTSTLGGTVTDFADLPVTGARVDIAGETVYTDSSGRYEFLGLAQGAYNLRVSEVDCYTDYNAEVELNAAEVTHDVRLTLSTLSAPSGFVATADEFLLNSLSWDPVECAVRYNLYVSTDAGASSTLLGQVSPPEASFEHSLASNCDDLWYSVAPIGLDGREAEATQWEQVSPIRALIVSTDATIHGDLCFEENLIINQSAVLTVAPGSELHFADDCGIDVYGGLMALGDTQSEILIEGLGQGATWGHIAFCSTSDPQFCKLSYVTIQDGEADYGGAIYCDGASPMIEFCTITGNTAPQKGGAIYCTGVSCSPTIYGNSIIDNLSPFAGGGIDCEESSSPIIEANVISGNSARYGAGIHCTGGSNPSILNNTINANFSTYTDWGGGGGISCGAGSALVRGNTVTANVGLFGGGIACYSNQSTVEDNTVSSNSALWGGGIAVYTNSSSVIRGNTIADNYALYEGGGICSGSSSPDLTGNTISGNSADRYGGGIFTTDGSPQVRGNAISSNSAVWGGGIACEASSATIIEDTTLTSNSAAYGGGIFCHGAWPTIRSNLIIGNEASGDGGGVSCYQDAAGHSPIIFNNLIVDNLAYVEGGGVFADDSSPRMNNNTIVYNTGYGGGDGIYNYGLPGPTIFDCIIWDNASESLHGCPNVTYSCIEGGDAGVGNIQSHPLFDGPCECYYLKATSPCIDKGSQSAENAGMAKRTTQLDNTPDTGQVDMGYHYPIPPE